MKIVQLALGLIERHGDLCGAKPALIDDIAARYTADITETADLVKVLFEKRAGFATHVAEVSAGNRLGNPRLKTTYPDERRRALTARMLGYNDELAKVLPKLFELAVKRELAQVELAEERRRDRDYADAAEAREALGVYVEVIETIDILYNDYGVTRRHYACLSDEDHRNIAAIILRRPPSLIPVVRRRNKRGGRDG